MSNRIKELREAQGLSLSALGRRVGASKGWIQKLETGSGGLTVDWMGRLAAALDCLPSDLLVDDDVRHRLTADEEAFLNIYRKLNAPGRERAARVLNALSVPCSAGEEDRAA